MSNPNISRRQFLAATAGATLATAGCVSTAVQTRPEQQTAAKAAPRRYNVLFIMSDDMKNEPATWGGRAITPTIDALAKQGIRFDRAYCQFPLCNPSRASMLTGRSPGATGVLGNRTWFGNLHPDLVSLPKYFKQNGYVTLKSGKIFHGGIDDTEAWIEGGERRIYGGDPQGDAGKGIIPGPQTLFLASVAQATPGTIPASGPDQAGGAGQKQWVVMPGNGETDGDYQRTSRAIEMLRAHKTKYQDKPFFLGLGFGKPHSPPGAPQKFYDLYDTAKINLPVDYAVKPTVPEGFPVGSIRPRNADLFIGRDSTQQEAKEVIKAYLASISYVDSNMARVLHALDELELRDSTIVVFCVDHGYQLGEKGKWSKAGSLFEEGSRTPLIIHVPGAAGNSQSCSRIVEELDYYPTLVELCGLPKPKGLEGQSFVPLINNPTQEWDKPAYTIWSEDGVRFTGVGVRTDRWRYAEYILGGSLLLDMQNDPHQLKNLANDPKYADVKNGLAKLVAEYRDKHGPEAA